MLRVEHREVVVEVEMLLNNHNNNHMKHEIIEVVVQYQMDEEDQEAEVI
jgi:uncharacterized membrane protein YvbJ